MSRSLLHEINEVVTPELFYAKKNYDARGCRGPQNFDIPIDISNKLAYLQLITVSVYGNGSPKRHVQDYLNFQQNLWIISEFILEGATLLKINSFFGIF